MKNRSEKSHNIQKVGRLSKGGVGFRFRGLLSNFEMVRDTCVIRGSPFPDLRQRNLHPGESAVASHRFPGRAEQAQEGEPLPSIPLRNGPVRLSFTSRIDSGGSANVIWPPSSPASGPISIR